MNADIITRLPWDSKHFGIDVAKVNANRLTEQSVCEVQAWLGTNTIDCLYFMAVPEAATLQYAAGLGFRFVDARVTLESAPRPTLAARGIRLATPGDLPNLYRIAAESHHDSRFYVDGRFKLDACNELYRIWITKGLSDEGGAVFVPDIDGNPAGYISINVKNGVGHISLLAVDAQYRGRHLATELMRAANSWFLSREVTKFEVPTQAGNIPALRLYESCGFRISQIEPWYHRWTAEQPSNV